MPSNYKRKITITNTQSDPIVGILLKHNTTKPLLIICHGYGSSMEHPAIKKISESLYIRGHNVFTFNFSKSAQATAIEEQTKDIESIIKYFIEYKGVMLLAGSFGALSSSIAALQSKKVKGLITINGFFGTRHLGITSLRLYLLYKGASFFLPRYKHSWQFLKKAYQPRHIKIPVLVIHSSTDSIVFIKQSQLFYNSLSGQKTFYTLTNADHHLTAEQSVLEVVEAINKWLRTIIV
ncbi:MAG TPA: PhoPQ-activated protein PqaA family protein [Candidatus Sulfotelmatobacter sp.]|jgi:pimeloyl-ACP methyl ester carboxylesterase|nr:PhoPQ-activated protein PqaA family protein [Candidatus Sulfotelmatobacter sp.]